MNQYREWENIHCIPTHANRRLKSNFLYQQRSLALFNVKFGEKIKRGESKAGDRDCGGTSSQLESPDAKFNDSVTRKTSFIEWPNSRFDSSLASAGLKDLYPKFYLSLKKLIFRSTPEPCGSEHQRDLNLTDAPGFY